MPFGGGEGGQKRSWVPTGIYIPGQSGGSGDGGGSEPLSAPSCLKAGRCQEQMSPVRNPQSPDCPGFGWCPPYSGTSCQKQDRNIGSLGCHPEQGSGDGRWGWGARKRVGPAGGGLQHQGGSLRSRTFGLAMAFELPSQDCVKGEMSRWLVAAGG